MNYNAQTQSYVRKVLAYISASLCNVQYVHITTAYMRTKICSPKLLIAKTVRVCSYTAYVKDKVKYLTLSVSL
jgi:hypothetical protein